MTQIQIQNANSAVQETVHHLLSEAIIREQQILQAALDKTSKRLQYFEQLQGQTSEQFFALYQQGNAGDSDTAIDWAGEYQILIALKNKLSSLKDIVLARS